MGTERVALLDVNVLVALFDPDHVHHETAHDWFADNRAHGWATCPLTENGLLRVLGNPAYHSAAPRPAALARQLQAFCESGHHHHWPDTISLRDAELFLADGAWSHRQLTDVYLLGLAVKMGGRLVTFDRAIRKSAVRAAGDHLDVIAPIEDRVP